MCGFKCRKDLFRFDEGFIQNQDEDSDKEYILEVNVKYPKELHKIDSDLPILPEDS